MINNIENQNNYFPKKQTSGNVEAENLSSVPCLELPDGSDNSLKNNSITEEMPESQQSTIGILRSSHVKEMRHLYYDSKTGKTYDPYTREVINPATREPTGEIVPEAQDTGNKEKGEETEEDQDPIKELLKNYKLSENPNKNFELAERFIAENYKNALKSTVYQVITRNLKGHFKLNSDAIEILKIFWSDLQKEQKKIQEATKTPTESRKEAKKREANEVQEERERSREERLQGIEKRKVIVAELCKILENEDGKHSINEIEAAKSKIKETMMPDFSAIVGRNLKTGIGGHRILMKLAIADYLYKTYHLVRFGGRIWRYDWGKGYYTYDPGDVLLHQEVVSIMTEVGDNEYIYNDNSIVDKLNIIDMASNNKSYIQNPFNKYTDLINARNGVFKLDYTNRTVTLLGKQPKYMFSYCIDTEYKPEIQNDVIHEMLGEIVGEEQRDLIYQMAAIAIRDTDPKLIPSKVAYLFIGPKNTGKNVVMQVLNDFFGTAIVSRIPLNEIAENKFVKPLLEGKVINLDDELPETLPLKESREIKSLTGGKFHSIEPKHTKPYSGIITALLVFAGNQFPKCSISKNDGAFWDRWEIINFDNLGFPVDEDFNNRMLTPENLSGFFNRVIDKLFEIRDRGITRRHNTIDTYHEWLHSSSTVYRFYHEMTSPVEERVECKREEFFKYYIEWCNWLDIPFDDRCNFIGEFSKELANFKVKEVDVKEKDVKKRYYVYRMFRKYDRTRFNVPDGGDSGKEDIYDIPDCGYYPRKR